jgi:hypothetical protein
MDVFTMLLIVLCIANPMISKAFFLPYQRPERQFLLGTEGKSAFDVLTGFFQRDVCSRRDNQMEVVRHNHELMQKVAALRTIVLKNVEKQAGHFLFLEKRAPSVRNGRDKECADFLWSVVHFPPALKRIILNDPYAALAALPPSPRVHTIACVRKGRRPRCNFQSYRLETRSKALSAEDGQPMFGIECSSRLSAKKWWKNGPSGP